MQDDLIAAHGSNEKLMPYLHLPFQSGSDSILKAMNRRHTRNDYLKLIDRIRAKRPDIALSTDIIVGFPGETDSDFEDTMALVDEVGFASAYSFKYSPRPGTPGAEMDNQVEEAVKKQRLAILQDRLTEQQRSFNESKLDEEMMVLLEKPGRHPGQLIGRSPWLQAVHLEAEGAAIGEMVAVKIKGATLNSLQAVMIPSILSKTTAA